MAVSRFERMITAEGECNLAKMFACADIHDAREGKLAYQRYHAVMCDLAQRFAVPLERAVAVFCALSPNNDYAGNLRSAVTALDGYRRGLPTSQITVSTYRHCLLRAMDYARGDVDFLQAVRGLKIRSFYQNILNPEDHRWVTVDGHVVAAWYGRNLTMKEAIVRGPKEYHDIETTIKRLAFSCFLLPNQYQAILWFARKRSLRVRYDPQGSLFVPTDDLWKTRRNVAEIEPYGVPANGQLHNPDQCPPSDDPDAANRHQGAGDDAAEGQGCICF